MNKSKKLKTIVDLLDEIASLDKSFGINESSLRKLYNIISEIKDDDKFNDAYKLIIIEISSIFDKLQKLGIDIDKLNIKNQEKIENITEKNDLKNLEKDFN